MKRSLGNAGELFPQSVFIIASYDEDGVPNAMNAAWAGECSRHEVCFNIGDHKTTANIVRKGAFTVAPADAANVVTADYFGIATGNRVNKAEGSGLTFTRSEHVDAPVIEEYPLTMECEVTARGRGHPRRRRQGRLLRVAPARLRRLPHDLPRGGRRGRRRLERGQAARVAARRTSPPQRDR